MKGDGFENLPAKRELEAFGRPHLQRRSHHQDRMGLDLQSVITRRPTDFGHSVKLLPQLFSSVRDVAEPFDEIRSRV
ncbi:hypothetical protein D3C72_2250460 [compost metagenome]